MVAVDGSPSALHKASGWITKEGLPFKGAACCITRLPFQDTCFDAVVDVVSSAHNSHCEVTKIFKEVARVLKPGGRLFSISPTNICSRRPFVGLGTVNYLEQGEIKSLLDKSFTAVKILRSSYGIADDCIVDHWVTTATRRSP